MVPGMGAKISVLIQISFASMVNMIVRAVDVMFGKPQPVITSAGCIHMCSNLYLKEKLKSSAYICRLIHRLKSRMPVSSFNNTFSSGVFYATVF
jgi:hypothetical protein